MQTKRFYIQADAEGRVVRAILTAREMTAPWIDTWRDHWAEPTEQKDGYDAVMFWDGKAIVWQYEPTVPMPEPIPEPTEPQPPSRDDVEAMRQEAYRLRVDPITCEISRLRDMGGTEDEIAEAMARREQEVARIKREMPYPL